MQVKTGKGTVPMMVVLAIWSLSLAVNLPGLAVTPIEGSLRDIFVGSTDFKIQLLTMLPNIVIIPFVLLSGKLSESKHKITVITIGTVLFVAAGVLSIFSKSLNMLILLSCFLGAGCGLILPFSTGLIADVFTGKYKVKQMGIVSAIGNISLVAATFAVGFLVAGNLMHTWHRAFLVYLIPLLSLVLIPFLSKIPKSDYSDGSNPDAEADSKDARTADALGLLGEPGDRMVRGGFYVGRTAWLLFAYFVFIFINSVPCYYLPNLKWVSSEDASTIISVFYFAMFLSGMALTPVMKTFGKTTFIIAAAMIVAGFALYIFVRGSLVMYIIAALLCGLANGVAQPIFYTKATEIVTLRSKSTLALAFIQVANYIAISLVPVIIDSTQKIFHTSSTLYPFVSMGIASALLLAVVAVRSRHFVFGISESYY